MSRQVDVKALVSHIVRGDGIDKCRICMGDTSEGQVYLGDTVMLDGNKPVTLSELLETITGIEVAEEAGLPPSICRVCSEEITAAANTRQLCLNSHRQWERAVERLYLYDAPEPNDKALYVLYNEEGDAIIRDPIRKVHNAKEAFERLTETMKLPKKMRRPKIISKNLCCPDCGVSFSKAADLNAHLKKTQKRACFHCAGIFSREELSVHLSMEHGINLVHCLLCYKLLSDEEALRRHWDKHHGVDSHTCKLCGEGFPNERGLRAHMYYHTLFHCVSCTRSFESSKCFKQHKRHCKDKLQAMPKQTVYTCHDCGNTYDKKPSLRIHIVQKHLNVLPYVCSICGKRTSTITHLKSHQDVHKTERLQLQCVVCGAKMLTELGLSLHMRIHTGEKPYECAECGERFLSASRRLDHIKRRHTSTQEMPHGCNECKARFVRPVELKKHYAHVHNMPYKYSGRLASSRRTRKFPS